MKEDRRLRVAVLSRHFDPSAGGAERYAVSLVQHLAGRHDIEVFCQTHGDDIAGVVVHSVPKGPGSRWMNQLWFAAYTQWRCRRRFDVVHSHEATWFGNVQTVHVRPIKVNLFAGRRGLARWVRWLGVVISPRLISYLAVERARMSARPDRAIVAVSPPLRREIQSAYPGLANVELDIVPPGVSPLPAGTDTQREETRRASGASAQSFVLLCVANDHRKKGLPALLKALALLPQDMVLWVAGGSAEVRASQRLAEELGVGQRVRFLGRVDHPGLLYRAADLLVHPALEDTFGMVVPEAMSLGLPVVVSSGRWCGVADGLRDGEDALLLDDPTDPARIAAAVQRAALDPALRARLSAAGLAFASRLDWTNIARDQEAIYRRVAARAGRAPSG